MRKGILAIGLVLLALGLVAAACGGGEEEKTTSQSPGATSAPRTTAPAQATTAPAGALSVAQLDFRFDPDKLTAQAGKAVTVNVTNNGRVSHTFTITELNADKVLSPGEKATVTFTPSKAGTFAYFCRFHRSSGMEGTLQVS